MSNLTVWVTSIALSINPTTAWEANKKNREELLAYFNKTSSVEIYQKGHLFIKDGFADLDGWATDDDVMFLLQKHPPRNTKNRHNFLYSRRRKQINRSNFRNFTTES